MEILYSFHAIERIKKRKISYADVENIIYNGEVIETYPDDKPYPSQLTLGWIKERPIHVVNAYVEDSGKIIIITVYEPHPYKWNNSFRRRK